MQDDLFGGAAPPPPPDKTPPPKTPKPPRATAAPLQPAAQAAEVHALAAQLPNGLRLGTSSWTYPGWAGLVWDREHPDATLSKQGLATYAQHPLLRAVSIDRSFYRPLTTAQYARYAAQVPDDFRFVVKAPSAVCDALIRSEDGRGMEANPLFLNPLMAVQEFVLPALEGLGPKLGALVFQLSPLPGELLARLPEVMAQLQALLQALPPLRPTAPDAVVAVEVRDPAFVTPALATLLKAAGATYCLGLHAKMPPISEQLPLLRALWPGPLVCRWNLNPLHGAYGYEDAHQRYSPYSRLMDPDLATRQALARVIAGTLRGGQQALVTISNKAEGCAPLSVLALAEAVMAQTARDGYAG